MSRATALVLLSLCSAAVLAASAPPQGGAAATLPAGWKVSDEDARGHALDALVGGQFNYWVFKQGWNATPAVARAALVQGGLEWAKAFAASPAFAQAYAQRRAENKPEASQYDQTIEQEMAAERAKQAKELDDFKAQVKSMPADQQKAMKDVATMMEQQAAQMAKDPQMQAMIRQGKETERADRVQHYKDSMAQWQKDWPADPKPLIAKRLKQFLAACGDMDFAAKTIHDPAIDKQRFAETRYEMKPAEWKYCYRAGKPAVDAARGVATAWLKELPPG